MMWTTRAAPTVLSFLYSELSDSGSTTSFPIKPTPSSYYQSSALACGPHRLVCIYFPRPAKFLHPSSPSSASRPSRYVCSPCTHKACMCVIHNLTASRLRMLHVRSRYAPEHPPSMRAPRRPITPQASHLLTCTLPETRRSRNQPHSRTLST